MTANLSNGNQKDNWLFSRGFSCMLVTCFLCLSLRLRFSLLYLRIHKPFRLYQKKKAKEIIETKKLFMIIIFKLKLYGKRMKKKLKKFLCKLVRLLSTSNIISGQRSKYNSQNYYYYWDAFLCSRTQNESHGQIKFVDKWAKFILNWTGTENNTSIHIRISVNTKHLVCIRTSGYRYFSRRSGCWRLGWAAIQNP